jgi:uncharacterized protein DUF3175
MPFLASNCAIGKSRTALIPLGSDPRVKQMAQETKKWSDRVTRQSHALALEEGVFTWDDPSRIAASLKHSAETSSDRKSEPYRSAMSMLAFYINRAGRHLPAGRKKILEPAKIELKKQFNQS